ncbi:pantoate--beta-alanine ligase [Myxococcota bacterium]|nr:pantoate--beta-alanine ligase [Myxococcota bacterium]MBU1382070.1 pantoate--beta-alanine ligase [Myxococcota bacterium]MBU1496184.1 pantoate--beta-alanine ligase [Myxococcota bacterium]
MIVLKDISKLRSLLSDVRKTKTIGFVPTMGFLHEGHISLVKMCKESTEFTVVSIFVNPTQFAPTEDLNRYPRDEKGDLEKLENAGTDLVFFPDKATMYPGGFQTYVEVQELTKPLCGATRGTSHFRGVSTVVAKLFNMVQPDKAFFGKKDFQQLAVIKQMVKDLNYPVEIIPGETVRENDGLAMSSRNSYLSPADRKSSVCLSRGLFLARDKYHAGDIRIDEIELFAADFIKANAPQSRIDYVQCLDADKLTIPTPETKNLVLACAVFFQRTRLIDNVTFTVS